MRADGRGHWARGRRRQDCPTGAWLAALLRAGGIPCCRAARVVGVSDRTIRRWIAGTDYAPLPAILRLIDAALAGDWARGCPLVDPGMAIDGYTRVLGVGAWSRRAARGFIAV